MLKRSGLVDVSKPVPAEHAAMSAHGSRRLVHPRWGARVGAREAGRRVGHCGRALDPALPAIPKLLPERLGQPCYELGAPARALPGAGRSALLQPRTTAWSREAPGQPPPPPPPKRMRSSGSRAAPIGCLHQETRCRVSASALLPAQKAGEGSPSRPLGPTCGSGQAPNCLPCGHRSPLLHPPS